MSTHHTIISTKNNLERAYLVGVDSRLKGGYWTIESSIEELASLAKSAGAQIIGSLSQKVDKPSPNYYLGKGKLKN